MKTRAKIRIISTRKLNNLGKRMSNERKQNRHCHGGKILKPPIATLTDTTISPSTTKATVRNRETRRKIMYFILGILVDSNIQKQPHAICMAFVGCQNQRSRSVLRATSSIMPSRDHAGKHGNQKILKNKFQNQAKSDRDWQTILCRRVEY